MLLWATLLIAAAVTVLWIAGVASGWAAVVCWWVWVILLVVALGISAAQKRGRG